MDEAFDADPYSLVGCINIIGILWRKHISSGLIMLFCFWCLGYLQPSDFTMLALEESREQPENIISLTKKCTGFQLLVVSTQGK